MRRTLLVSFATCRYTLTFLLLPSQLSFPSSHTSHFSPKRTRTLCNVTRDPCDASIYTQLVEANTTVQPSKCKRTVLPIWVNRRNSYKIGPSIPSYIGTNLALEDVHSSFNVALSAVSLTRPVLFTHNCTVSGQTAGRLNNLLLASPRFEIGDLGKDI